MTHLFGNGICSDTDDDHGKQLNPSAILISEPFCALFYF